MWCFTSSMVVFIVCYIKMCKTSSRFWLTGASGVPVLTMGQLLVASHTSFLTSSDSKSSLHCVMVICESIVHAYMVEVTCGSQIGVALLCKWYIWFLQWWWLLFHIDVVGGRQGICSVFSSGEWVNRQLVVIVMSPSGIAEKGLVSLHWAHWSVFINIFLTHRYQTINTNTPIPEMEQIGIVGTVGCQTIAHVDEPPHQICSYTLLFSLFLHFLYITDPPLCTSAPTWPHAIVLTWQSHLLYQTDLTYLMDIWLMIHMYLLLFLVSPMCPLLQSDQSWALAPRGQALSITSPYAHILVYHSYLTSLYLPFTREDHHWSPNHLPIWVSPRIEILHLCFAPSCTYFALFRITSHCHNPTVSTCHNTPGDSPLPPDCTPSEPHRIYT